MFRLGIDLGGTNIAAGVVDEDYRILSKAKCKTNMPRKAEDIADDMAKTALEAIKDAGLKKEDICAVGIGTPGSVERAAGNVAYSPNLDFYNVKLADMIESRLNIKTYIENDANAAAYGEFIAGAGKGTENFVAVTLGTGVGGGIIIDKKIYSGSNGAGGELGHTVIKMNGERCACGRSGCFEAYASATALVRQTKKAMKFHRDSLMWKLCGGNIDKANGKTAFDAMRKNDAAAKEVVTAYIEYLAVGITNIINIFQPQVLCIGGGISGEGETLTEPLNKLVQAEDYAHNMYKRTVIKPAALGNDAGIIGAAFLDKLS